MALLRFAIAALLLCGGCGAALVDDAYRGEALLSTGSLPAGFSQEIGDDHPIVRVGLFWDPHGIAPIASFSSLQEQVSNDEDQSFPGQFDWQLFDPPRTQDYAPGGLWALALPGLYLDDNHDGRLGAGEHVVGTTPQNAILYAARDLAPAESPTGLFVSAGYHAMTLPLACGRPQPPPGNDTCDVELGAACRSDSDCGHDPGARCLVDGPTPPPAPGGECVLVATPGACHPANARIVKFGPGTYQMLACNRDTDCTRISYQCDVALGVCVATRGVHVVLGDDVAPPALCQQPR